MMFFILGSLHSLKKKTLHVSLALKIKLTVCTLLSYCSKNNYGVSVLCILRVPKAGALTILCDMVSMGVCVTAHVGTIGCV